MHRWSGSPGMMAKALVFLATLPLNVSIYPVPGLQISRQKEALPPASVVFVVMPESVAPGVPVPAAISAVIVAPGTGLPQAINEINGISYLVPIPDKVKDDKKILQYAKKYLKRDTP